MVEVIELALADAHAAVEIGAEVDGGCRARVATRSGQSPVHRSAFTLHPRHGLSHDGFRVSMSRSAKNPKETLINPPAPPERHFTDPESRVREEGVPDEQRSRTSSRWAGRGGGGGGS